MAFDVFHELALIALNFFFIIFTDAQQGRFKVEIQDPSHVVLYKFKQDDCHDLSNF